jgi:hypothetical protein
MLVARQGRRNRAGRARLTRASSASSIHAQACLSSRFRVPNAQLLWRPSLRRPKRCFKRPPPAKLLAKPNSTLPAPFHALVSLSPPLLASAPASARQRISTAYRTRRAHAERASRTWRAGRACSPRRALVRCRGVRPPARPVRQVLSSARRVAQKVSMTVAPSMGSAVDRQPGGVLDLFRRWVAHNASHRRL